MTLTATSSALPREPAETHKLLLVIWAATAAAYLLAAGGTPDLSTDDAMRLVQVRDWLAGQGWFDLVQYRLDPPAGVAMHWSRLVDLPIAVLIRAGEIAVPATLAERIALMAWPAALLLGFLAGAAMVARELGGDAAAKLALIFAAMTAAVLQHFRPGAIDHHNIQLVLMLASLALAMRARAQPAALAGMLCALSLAIGQEMAPVIAACAAGVVLRFIARGDDSLAATAAFGLAFAAATVVLFAATVPPAHYGAVACDALSVAQTLVAILGGAGLAALASWRGLSSAPRRAAAMLGLGLGIAVLTATAFPACLGDPYAFLDPRLSALWLSNVSEARSVVSLLRDLPQDVLPYYGMPALGIALGLVRCRREPGAARWAWAMATIVLCAATLIALWQVRGCAAANAVALALMPAALVRSLPARAGHEIFLGMGRAVLVAALLLSPLTLIGLGKALARALETASSRAAPTVIADGPGTCRDPADYAPLRRLPRGLVLGFIDAGPLVLMQTPHAVLAAPYHRNVTGNTAMLDLFLGPPREAAARLAALEVDYVAFCPGAPEQTNYAAAAPDGLAAALGRGEVPAGLEPISLDGTGLRVYRRR